MNEPQKRSSITTKGVVPIPVNPKPNSNEQQKRVQETRSTNPVAPSSGRTVSSQNSRVITGTETGINSNASAGTKVSAVRNQPTPSQQKTRAGSTGPNEQEKRNQRTSQLAASADVRDKHGRTPKQKRREDFLVNSLSTFIFLGTIFGGLYYAYTMVMDVIG